MGRTLENFYRLTDEQLQKLIDGCRTQTELAAVTGMRGGNLKLLRDRILQPQFNTSRWNVLSRRGGDWSRRPRNGLKPSWSEEARRKAGSKSSERFRLEFENSILPLLFIENCPYEPARARGFIRHWNSHYKWLTHRCDSCGTGPVWNSQPLTLQIDHRNGKTDDNRLENLRFLCPNCHSQTENWGWRNYHRKKLDGRLDHSEGVEPSSSGPEPDVLPLDDE